MRSRTFPLKHTLLVAASLLVSGQALASNTLCDFRAGQGADRYAFELIGPGELTTLQVNEPRPMRLADYTIHDFSYRERRIDLSHSGSDRPGFLPAFTLRGAGERVVLHIGGRDIVGSLTCQWQYDAR